MAEQSIEELISLIDISEEDAGDLIMRPEHIGLRIKICTVSNSRKFSKDYWFRWEALLSQMKEAGLSHKDVKDEVTDQDKKLY